MATEDRWHDFAKEKPSEDMEGRNFIVSNGYSDTLSMWCGGYWENEPFMGNKLCDEVVRWKGYLTPEEEKANSQCDIDEVDCTAAELKQKLEDVQASMYCDVVDANMENRRLKRALWLARALRAEARKNYWYARSCHEGDKYLWSIDGSAVKYIGCIKRTNYDWLLTWSEVESKCQAKAEEYK